MSDKPANPVDVPELQTPLAALEGAVPPAPQWFKDAINVRPQSTVIEVDGAPIHYLSWGSPAKQGLLLVHGNAAHAWWWSRMSMCPTPSRSTRRFGPARRSKMRRE